MPAEWKETWNRTLTWRPQLSPEAIVWQVMEDSAVNLVHGPVELWQHHLECRLHVKFTRRDSKESHHPSLVTLPILIPQCHLRALLVGTWSLFFILGCMVTSASTNNDACYWYIWAGAWQYLVSLVWIVISPMDRPMPMIFSQLYISQSRSTRSLCWVLSAKRLRRPNNCDSVITTRNGNSMAVARPLTYK